MRSSLKVTAIYFFVAGTWVLGSDWFFSHAFPSLFGFISMVKGGAFVVLTALMLYLLLRREFAKRDRVERDLLHLAEDRQRFERMIRDNDAVMLLIDQETLAIVEANPAAEAFYGVAAGGLLTKSLSAFDKLPAENYRGVTSLSTTHRAANGQKREVAIHFSSVTTFGRPCLFAIVDDVTAQRQAEAAARAGESRLRLLAESLDDMITRIDLNGRYLYASAAAERLFGQDAATLVGQKVVDYVHPDDVENILGAVRDAPTAEGPLTVTFRRRHADGRYLWVESTVSSLRDEQGKPIEVGGSTRDITARRRRMALDQLHIRIFELLSGDGSLDAIFALIVHSVELAFPGTRCAIVLADKAPSEPPHGLAAWFSEHIHDNAGHVIGSFVLARSKPVAIEEDEAATLRPFVHLASVAIERSRARDEMVFAARIVETSEEAIVVTDSDDRIIAANPAFSRMTGYDRVETIGRKISFLGLTGRAAGTWNALRQAADKDGFWQGEVDSHRKDGQRRVFWLTINPVAEGLWHSRKHVWMFFDVTDRVDSVRRLAEGHQAAAAQAAELARSNADLEQFAYVASHDLRQPLRHIANFARVLEDRYGPALDDEGREYLGFIRNGADRLDRLIVGLLDYARVGRRTLPKTMVDFDDVVREAVVDLRPAIEDVGGTLTIATAAKPARTIGDRAELVRLVRNLVDNALKYRAPTRPLAVAITMGGEEGNVWLQVKDNGIGFDPQFKDRIFGLFQRLHSVEHYEGTGIGLAVCKKIVERHGGQISVTAAPNDGASFVVVLPGAVEELATEP
jgi:PAS domain S-box-containing protein